MKPYRHRVEYTYNVFVKVTERGTVIFSNTSKRIYNFQ